MGRTREIKMSEELEHKSKNIYQRINAVMQKIDYVKKDKAVSGGGQNYKAVTHDQVISVCRKELVANGIVIVHEQIRGEIVIRRDLASDIKMHLYAGEYLIHFVNIDSPQDRISVSIHAHAADNGDKAPGKCITYATKAAILKTLSLETGEDDESRTYEPEPPKKQPITDARLAKAIDKIRIGEYTMESLNANFDLTEAQQVLVSEGLSND
jgi:hypothetical protein